MSQRAQTDFLFPTGGFLTGAGSVFNIAGSYFLYNATSEDEDADSRAIACDWSMVGQDIRDAMGGFSKETEKLS
jgi:hypothetical protein